MHVLDLLDGSEPPSEVSSVVLDSFGLTSLTGLSQLPMLKRCDLSFNKLSTVDFCHETSCLLIELYLTYNDLTSMDSFSSLNLSKLVILDLSYNKLTSISNLGRAFSLHTLNLSNNFLSEVHQPFIQCSPLRLLDLSYNDITSISTEVISSFPSSLQELCLNNNHLTSLPSISHLSSLTYLDVSSNMLSCTSFLSSSLPFLDQLYIDNQATDLTSIDLPYLPALSLLSLTNNSILALPNLVTICPHLEVLLLSKNSFVDFKSIAPVVCNLTSLFRLDIDLKNTSIDLVSNFLPGLEILNGDYITEIDELDANKEIESQLSQEISSQLTMIQSFKSICDSLEDFCEDVSHRKSLLKSSSPSNLCNPSPIRPISAKPVCDINIPLSSSPINKRSPLHRRHSYTEGMEEELGELTIDFDDDDMDIGEEDIIDDVYHVEGQLKRLLGEVAVDLSVLASPNVGNRKRLLSAPAVLDQSTNQKMIDGEVAMYSNHHTPMPLTSRSPQPSSTSPVSMMAASRGKTSPLEAAEDGLRKMRRTASKKARRVPGMHPKVRSRSKNQQKGEDHSYLFSWG
ncbi:hypothetical protein P9112_012113 [Eukaryota sp. TZLM1-RC]